MIKKQKVNVIQPKNKPELALDIMAEHIQKISELGKEINASKFNKTGLLVLLKHATGMSMSDIKKVLDALPELKRLYLK